MLKEEKILPPQSFMKKSNNYLVGASALVRHKIQPVTKKRHITSKHSKQLHISGTENEPRDTLTLIFDSEDEKLGSNTGNFGNSFVVDGC